MSILKRTIEVLKNKFIFIAFVSCLLLGVVFIFYAKVTSNLTCIKVAYPNKWGDLSPSERKVATANSILMNIYEPLVVFKENGQLGALGSRSWTISSDNRSVIFKINTSKKFSDGTRLSAKHYKQYFENSLNKNSNYKDSALASLLGKVKGWEEFDKGKHLSGIRADDDETLEIIFNVPASEAILDLALGRYGVVLERGDKSLGTGYYAIRESGPNEIILIPNKYNIINNNSFCISVVPSENAIEKMKKNEIDIFPKAEKVSNFNCNDDDQIACLLGDEESHNLLELNTLKGKFFHSPEMRKGLFALIFTKKSIEHNIFSYIDPRFFFKFQLGYLDERTLNKIIAENSKYIPLLMKKIQAQKIKYMTGSADDPVLKFLKDIGMQFTPDSGVYEVSELVKAIKKTHDADIVHLSLGVVSGDPGDIYYIFGKNGTMMSPMNYSEDLNVLFEMAEKELIRSKREKIYLQISKLLIEDPKIIHIGFINRTSIYRKDKISIRGDKTILNDRRLHFYETR